MSKLQVIEKDSKPVFYVVPADLWERMREAAEDAEDIADLERFDRDDDSVRCPAPVAYAMADGATALWAWRGHKGKTLQAPADAAGLSKPYMSQIEGCKRTGTGARLKKLARALDLPVGGLDAVKASCFDDGDTLVIRLSDPKPLDPQASPTTASRWVRSRALPGLLQRQMQDWQQGRNKVCKGHVAG